MMPVSTSPVGPAATGDHDPDWDFFLPDEGIDPDEEEPTPEPGDFWIDATDEDEF